MYHLTKPFREVLDEVCILDFLKQILKTKINNSNTSFLYIDASSYISLGRWAHSLEISLVYHTIPACFLPDDIQYHLLYGRWYTILSIVCTIGVSGKLSCPLQVGCVHAHIVPAANCPPQCCQEALRSCPGRVGEKPAKLANAPRAAVSWEGPSRKAFLREKKCWQHQQPAGDVLSSL